MASSISALSVYSFARLDQQSDEIRILALWPSKDPALPLYGFLHTAPVEDQPSYAALSYTWGKDHSGCIYLLHEPYPITSNLEDALRHLRDDELVINIWVDAISINQQDLQERNHQVRRMNQIYRNATLVLIWLGRDDGDAQDAMDFVRRTESMKPSDLQVKPIDWKLSRALASLFTRPWWSRLWCVQEIVAAPRAVVVCGSIQLPWLYFEEAARFLSYPNAGKFVPQLLSFHQDRMLGLMNIRHTWRGEDPVPPPGLEQLLIATSEYAASDPHDNIFALVGLLQPNEQTNVRIDYAMPVRNVFIEALLLTLKSPGRRNSLSLIEFSLGPSNYSLPSWCPDFSRSGWLEECILHRWGYKSRNAPGAAGTIDRSTLIYVPEKEVLQAKGYIIGTVDLVEVPPPFIEWPEYDDIGAPGANETFIAERFIQLIESGVQSITEILATLKFLRNKFINTLTVRMTAERAMECARRGDLFHTMQGSNELTLPSNLSVAGRFENLEYMCRMMFDEGKINVLSEEERYYLRDSLGRLKTSMAGCSFFTTESGYFGRARFPPQNGDIVCALVGCQMPAILRQTCNAYKIVSFASIHAAMDGEILKTELGSNETLFELL